MKKRTGCKCHPNSPFLWESDIRPSIFMADRSMRTPKTVGHPKTPVPQARRPVVSGISRNREKEMLRMRDFKSYSHARRSEDELGVRNVRVEDNGNVAA